MHKERRLAHFALLFYVALSLLFLFLPLSSLVVSLRIVLGYAFFPSIEGAQTLAQRLGNVPGNVMRMLNAESENVLLRARLREAEVLAARYKAVSEENSRLAQIAELPAAPGWSGVWARVIDRDPARWHSVVSIGKGSADGLAVRSAVLGVGDGKLGLVGKVIEVSRDVSKVLLITDEMSSVSCYLEGKGFDGLVEGRGTDYLKLNYMPSDAQLAAGDQVLTSPSSAVFPAGVPVGRVARLLHKDDFMTYTSAEVVPAVRLSAVKEVFVITGLKRAP